MRILIVSAWCPYPADNGSRLRAYNLILQLQRLGHHLTLIALGQDDSDFEMAASGLESLCAGGATFFPSRFFRPGTLRAVVGYLSPKPRMLLDTFQKSAAVEIARQCRSGSFDLVLALELGIAHYIPADCPVPCVLDQVEVSSFVRALDETKSPGRRARLALMVTKFRAHVRSLAPRFALWTAVSQEERGAIHALIGRSTLIAVLPNGVDLAWNAYEPNAIACEDHLIYNGAVTFYANRDAVEYFVHEILPRIASARPHAHLYVTGSVQALAADDPLRADPAVTLTGYLEDIRPAVRGAAACVVPLRHGGGTRLKILEAMALGTPVVATTRGAEGILATPDEEIFIADTPPSFADAALRLMNDPLLRRRIGAAGRLLVERSYGWDAIGAQLSALLQAENEKSRQRA